LPLSVFNHPHFKLAFTNALFPPPIVIVYENCGFRRNIKSSSKVRFHIDEVVNDSLGNMFFLGYIFCIKLICHDKLPALLHQRSSSEAKESSPRGDRSSCSRSLPLQSSSKVGTTASGHRSVCARPLKPSYRPASIRHRSHHLANPTRLPLSRCHGPCE